ncbi:MAG: non-canonical purine NTP pyrophosphatase [Geminicoccaceae bacterium]|nr:MAG: non-canonical purine NTP pyrophosphatase [Geminicoccaceae bacterium]
MARAFTQRRLLLATHNPGKVREFEELLAPTGVALDMLGDLPEPAETGASFFENARIKAEAAVAATGQPALADDSGLEVRGLGGAPGIDSALWAAPGRDFGPAMARIERELVGKYGSLAEADLACAFVAVLVLAWPDGHLETVEGRLEGTLAFPPRGQGGFGYDPIVQPLGETRTCAELTMAEKAAISHRGRAVRALIQRCWPHVA